MSKHDLDNMIFNLEERKDLKKVEFTQKAVIEVLGYLKQLADLEAKLTERETDLSLARNEINTLRCNMDIVKKHDADLYELFFKKCEELAEKEKENNTLTDWLLEVFTKFRTGICNSKDTLSIHDNRVDVYLSYIRVQECLDIATNLEFDTKREINKLKEIK